MPPTASEQVRFASMHVHKDPVDFLATMLDAGAAAYSSNDVRVKGNRWVCVLNAQWSDYDVVLASRESSSKQDAKDQVIRAFRQFVCLVLKRRSLLKFGTSLSYYTLSRRPDVGALYEHSVAMVSPVIG